MCLCQILQCPRLIGLVCADVMLEIVKNRGVTGLGITEKEQFRKYASRNHLADYITEDLTNFDITVGRRNWIRGVIAPLFEQQQIGLKKILRKRYLKLADSVIYMKSENILNHV